MAHQASSRRWKALTLVELITVVAIILLLIAILLPVINQVRKRGQEVACLSNLRQLGAAWQMYTQDHKDYPPTLLQVLPYVKSKEVYACPLDAYTGANPLLTDEAGFIVSYYNIPEDETSEKPRTALRTLDPNHGILVCILHGQIESPVIFPRAVYANASGIVLRVVNDGSVRRVHVPKRCYRDAQGSLLTGRYPWFLFSDAPCPRELCPLRDAEIPCP
ncbi:MAG: hypothetical protein KatS3mg019_1694 [Fimbriimonadales bacterium]|nr:MAG: hypothetical protein KatS3mg019_1694 [Fimbriimonadales bacterium]